MSPFYTSYILIGLITWSRSRFLRRDRFFPSHVNKVKKRSVFARPSPPLLSARRKRKTPLAARLRNGVYSVRARQPARRAEPDSSSPLISSRSSLKPPRRSTVTEAFCRNKPHGVQREWQTAKQLRIQNRYIRKKKKCLAVSLSLSLR